MEIDNQIENKNKRKPKTIDLTNKKYILLQNKIKYGDLFYSIKNSIEKTNHFEYSYANGDIIFIVPKNN